MPWTEAAEKCQNDYGGSLMSAEEVLEAHSQLRVNLTGLQYFWTSDHGAISDWLSIEGKHSSFNIYSRGVFCYQARSQGIFDVEALSGRGFGGRLERPPPPPNWVQGGAPGS